jgi:DNA-binding SARP family transcriptional activator/tetratricopeptide (TPR) repeat protein
MGTGLEFEILGPLEVRHGGAPVHVGGPRQRALLVLLLCHANRVVSRDQLIDELLAGQPAGSAERMLRVQVSRLRRAIADDDGPPRLIARPPGYLLRVEPGELDLQVFEQRVAAGRGALDQGDPGQAAMLLAEAESLWRGRPLADLEFEPFARFEIQRLQELRLAAAEDRIEAELAIGRHNALCAELERLVAEHPLRERLRGQLMVALYRSGRQADALETYRAGRSQLVAELGVEPGPALRHVHEQVLAADPVLDPPAPLVAGSALMMVPRELPADVSGFTGRAAELAELDLLLPGLAGQDAAGPPGAVVISAVAGTAGVGKTALAVRWAHRVAGQFPDGQLYVNLRGYDPDQPVTASEALAGFLRALGVAGQDIPVEKAERAARFRSVVADRRLLLLLDNAATEEQVRPLLPGSSSVMVLVTSRDALAGLITRDGARRLDLDLLPLEEAVALLGTLIGARAEGDPATVTLAQMCARLPLALRVAAHLAVARPDTTLAEQVAELASRDTRLALLDAGGDPRAAVASVFSWSYSHLAAGAARMFRLLGLHPAQEWDRCAAAALAATTLARASQLLAVLARAHLIQLAAPGRYQMHDLLRAYAAGLAASHDNDQAQHAALTRLFDYYLATCASAMDWLHPAGRRRRPDPPQTLTPVPRFGDRTGARAWLDAELPTLVSVAAHAAGKGWLRHTMALADTLSRYLFGGHLSEGLAICTDALRAARKCGDRAGEASMLNTVGNLYYFQGDFRRATDHLSQALALAHGIGDGVQESRALCNLATIDDQQGRYQQAASRQRRALAISRELGDQFGETVALLDLGLVRLRQGRYQQAASHLERALTRSREINYRYGEASVLANLGEVCYRQGLHEQAGIHLRDALALSREIGDLVMEARALTRLGELCHRRGEHDQAAEQHRRALALHREIGHSEQEAEALNKAGETLLAVGQPGRARSCHTTALTLTRRNGDRYQHGRALIGLGEVSRQLGQHDQAGDYHQQALSLLREIGDRGGQAEALNGSGETLLATGQHTQAQDSFAAALTLARRTGDRYQQARAHHGLAGSCRAAGDTSSADRHWRRALDIYTDLGTPEATHMHTSPVPARTQLRARPAPCQPGRQVSQPIISRRP